jgi:outer membrane protein assembly factor BamB
MRSCMWVAMALVLSAGTGRAEEAGLIGHWKLERDARDSSGNGLHGVNRGVEFADGAARFDGRRAFIEVPAHKILRLGKGDFSFAVWAHTAGELDDVPGDLLSLFDPEKRRGVTWCIKNGAGATTSQANFRNVHFGIDAGTEPVWRDVGRPGNSVYDMALGVHDGELYVGTCEPAKESSGHVYRYAGGTEWVDCGSPDKCNAVTALAVYDGKLYAGVGRYRLRGSALPESTNPHAGGKVYRHEGGKKWVDCGQLPEVDAVGGLAVFRGRLYATSLYRPAGFFRYESGTKWTTLGTPKGGRRVGPLAVFNGHLYAGSYDGCTVFRLDGEKWEDLGNLEPRGQSYSFEVHRGELFVGTWPQGRVFRRAGGKEWVSTGRLGEEREVMGMAVYNGKLYAGTLPLAEVYRYDGDGKWARTGRLDTTPEVRYRRAWSVAVFQGRLFVGTLPSGRVHALEAGKCVTYDRALAPGWRHLAAVKEGKRLRLYVDGKKVAESTPFDSSMFDLSGEGPLHIGTGANDHFNGRLRDLRLYRRALGAKEVRALAKPGPGRGAR